MGRIGQQHAGHCDGGEARAEQLQVAAQEDDPHGLALPAQPAGVRHLVVVLVQVVDRGVLARVLKQGLELSHQVGKEHVHDSLYDHDNAGAVLQLQVLGVGVGLEALLLYHRHHLLPRLLADVGVIVEHTGHGGHTVPGQPGYIFDGHRHPFFLNAGRPAGRPL